MSDYLSRLVARTFGVARVVQPRVPARFEPPTPFEGVQPLNVPTTEYGPASPPAPPVMKTARKREDESPPEASRAIEPEAFESEHVRLPPPTIQERVVSAARPDQESHREEDVEENPDLPHDTRLVSKVVMRPSDRTVSADHTTPARQVHTVRSSKTALKTVAAAEARAPDVESPMESARRTERSTHTTSVSTATPQRPAVLARPLRNDQAAPTIKVHIGRIEVRAVTTPPPATPRPAASKPVPSLALKDYLRHRREGRR
jgi:hypothetical protein